MRASRCSRFAAVPVVARRDWRSVTAGVFVLSALLAGGGPGGPPEVHAGHNTCALVAQAGGEAAVEAWALGALNGKLPMSFSDKVTVGHVPVTNTPIKVDVDATVKKPAKNVNIACTSSAFSSKLDIKAKVSGKAGSSTHEGDGRITGHYSVVAGSPVKICVSNINMASLNLQGVQNDVDNWIATVQVTLQVKGPNGFQCTETVEKAGAFHPALTMRVRFQVTYVCV